jgi:urease subunit gamma/beta
MRLTPCEMDKLLLHQSGSLAQKRYARGLRLNYTEAMALIATQLQEFIRDGESVANLMDKGKKILGNTDVMVGVPEMIHEVQVEGTFPDGTKLVTVHNPICSRQGSEDLALYGSGLAREGAADKGEAGDRLPGEYFIESGEFTLNEGRDLIEIKVTNMGDRPIQVGSHYPFFETNRKLSFDRAKAFGRRLNISSGTAVRFEPGETKKVELVRISGEQIVYGGNAITMGKAGDEVTSEMIQKLEAAGFMNQPE